MNKLEIVNSSNIEPNRNSLWFQNGTLKYYSPNGWESIEGNVKSFTVHLDQGDVEIEMPVATSNQIGGVRIMDSEQTHLLISQEGNLYVDDTDNYMDNNPHKIPTVAALQGLLMDVHGEKGYATTSNYGIVKQAKNVSSTSQPTTLGALVTKVNNLIVKLQDAGIVEKDN